MKYKLRDDIGFSFIVSLAIVLVALALVVLVIWAETFGPETWPALIILGAFGYLVYGILTGQIFEKRNDRDV